MTRVGLRAFLASGKLGLVEVGVERAFVEAAFGSPEAFDAESKSHHAAQIWRYVDVELHFEEENVWLIHIDRFSGPDGAPVAGAGVHLDPWVIVGGLSLDVFVDALSQAAIPHTIVLQPEFDSTLVRLSSGVEIGFSGASGDDRQLEFISRSRRPGPA